MDLRTEQTLRKFYAETRTIAVVGASTDPSKPAHEIPRYLQSQGYRILPVNPNEERVLGQPAHASLSDIEDAIDAVADAVDAPKSRGAKKSAARTTTAKKAPAKTTAKKTTPKKTTAKSTAS